MPRLNRDESTGSYFTDTHIDGENIAIKISDEGVAYLQQQGIEPESEIPLESLWVLEDKGWLSRLDESAPAEDGTSQYATIENESETGSSGEDRVAIQGEQLPTPKLQPRPWAEPENVQAMRDDAASASASDAIPVAKSGYTSADRDNADALRHPEDAAFVGSIWMWLLIVALVVIVVWAIIELL